jgi:ABC-2 type transport system ATP-binding protein
MTKISNVSKSFNSILVLDSINLEINQGDVIHIKGRNGSGKSTLLKIISGILSQDTGDIEFDEGTVVGALIENPSFIENETALFNVRFLYNLTNHFDLVKVDELFKSLELNIHEKKLIRNYSVGMRQKVGIIQAIMEDQNLVLLDEPTRGLDDRSTLEFSRIVQKLKDKKVSIIICAHDGVDLIEFNRRFTLNEGKLKEIFADK